MKIKTLSVLTLFLISQTHGAIQAESKPEYTPDQLRVMQQLERLDFDPAADAEPEDDIAHEKSFEEATGIDPSPFYDQEALNEHPLWVPVKASGGKTLIDINLSTNRLVYYRNGAVALSTHISHGRKGKRTPTGPYRVLSKDADKWSRTYSEYDRRGRVTKKAWMRYSLNFIGETYAIHEGNTGGQSRGCIRVPYGVGRKLFGMVSVGTRISIHR